MTREAPLSPVAMRAAGWVRVDPRPWSKLRARWEHTGGWVLEHCGHPTALWPWALYSPTGEMVCTGVRATPPNPEHGGAWPDLRAAVTYVSTQRSPTP